MVIQYVLTGEENQDDHMIEEGAGNGNEAIVIGVVILLVEVLTSWYCIYAIWIWGRKAKRKPQEEACDDDSTSTDEESNQPQNRTEWKRAPVIPRRHHVVL